MKRFLLAFILINSVAFAQSDTSEFKLAKDSVKYPYIKFYTPPLIGIVAGYNFFQSQELEVGVMWNISQAENLRFGGMFGPSLLYRRSIDRNLNAIDLDIGFYTAITFGVGINYNFNSSHGILGVRPFIGTTLFHIQLAYGYNILNQNNNEILDLKQHTIRLRWTIPVKRLHSMEYLDY